MAAAHAAGVAAGRRGRRARHDRLPDRSPPRHAARAAVGAAVQARATSFSQSFPISVLPLARTSTSAPAGATLGPLLGSVVALKHPTDHKHVTGACQLITAERPRRRRIGAMMRQPARRRGPAGGQRRLDPGRRTAAPRRVVRAHRHPVRPAARRTSYRARGCHGSGGQTDALSCRRSGLAACWKTVPPTARPQTTRQELLPPYAALQRLLGLLKGFQSCNPATGRGTSWSISRRRTCWTGGRRAHTASPRMSPSAPRCAPAWRCWRASQRRGAQSGCRCVTSSCRRRERLLCSFPSCCDASCAPAWQRTISASDTTKVVSRQTS